MTMYLKKIEISGFKSFAKKTDLYFKNQISGIVGPNGSGKSNTAEAFRFVLGEQSMKNMRGKKGEDLIFSGKTGRLNKASAKITFDNKDRSLNLDYDEVYIERTVYRDGSNEYLINNSKVRAKDVVELLTSANIGASGHHIISQGEADKILSISPKDRKSVLEEALGLKSFVIKKQESERKLEKTDENLKEVKIRERVNGPRIRFLEKEVEKIQKSKDLKEELIRLYKNFFPHKNDSKKKLSEINKEVILVENERNILEEKISKKRQELEKSKNTVIDKNNDGKEKQILDLEKEKEKIIFERKDLEKERAKIEYSLERMERELEIFETKKNDSKKSIEDYEKKVFGILEIISKALKSDISKLSFVAESILDFLGIKKNGLEELSFSKEDVSLEKEKNTLLNNKIISLGEIEDGIFKKIRILSSDSENTSEMISQEIKIEILQLEKEGSEFFSKLSILNNKKIEILKDIQSYEREETYVISIFGLEELQKYINSEKIKKEENILEKVVRTRIILESNGVNFSEDILDEYNQLKENQEFIKKEIEDLESAKKELNELIVEVESEIEKRFRLGIEKVNTEFAKFFSTLFMGGKGEIILIKIPIKNKDENKLDEFELGLDIKVSLPNKKISGLSMLSGGERSLTSIALLFAMSSITPPPFIILDETDAALDEANSKRYGDMIEKLAEHSQLILITHNRETMSRAGLLYGVTMDRDGVSRLLSISFEEGESFAK